MIQAEQEYDFKCRGEYKAISLWAKYLYPDVIVLPIGNPSLF